jgi:SNF2 family DNA or RNA helicase
MFSEKSLKAIFPANEWQKGRRLFNKKLVKNAVRDGNIVRGTVGSESYWTEHYATRLEYDPRDQQIASLCNCYVGYQCKHGAALAQYYLENKVLRGASKAKIEQWLSGFNVSEKSSSARALLYFLQKNSYDENDYLQLIVKSSRQKTRGGWSKSLASEQISNYLNNLDFVNDADSEIIAQINKGSNFRHEIKTHDLFAKIIATGRCYWLNNYDLDKPISLAEALNASWQWTELEDNLQTLRLVLDQPCVDIRFIKSQPLSYYHTQTNTIGLVNTNTQCDFEENLLASPTFSEEQLPWVMSKLALSLGEVAEKLPKPTLKQAIELTKPVVQLRLSSPYSHDPTLSLAKIEFNYNGNLISPANNNAVLTKDKQNQKIRIYRDLALEEKALALLKSKHFSEHRRNTYHRENEYVLHLQGSYFWHRFLHNTVPELKKQGWKITISDNFYYQELATDNVFSAQIVEDENDSHDFFSLALNLDINGKQMPAFPILLSAIEQLPSKLLSLDLKSDLNDQLTNDAKEVFATEHAKVFVTLDNGEFIALDYQSIKPLLTQFIELFMPNALQDDGSLQLSRFQGHQTLSMLDDQGLMTQGAEHLRQLAEKLKNFKQIKAVPIPKKLHAELRSYQQQGLNWLQFLREYQLNGILADDMGLGKTIQSLAHLQVEKQQKRLNKPCLIIAPTSVVFNWAQEIAKFTPDLSYVVVNGSDRHQHFDQLTDYDVVITSYALIVKDSDIYQELKFYYLILDEAQYIKNPKTKLYQAVISLKAEHKLCVTGTPMENHLGEFWAQFNFLLPGFLGGQKQFNKLFKTPIEKHSDHQRKVLLNQRIKPFILRRTKDKIATELPQKTEIIQTLRIEGKQAQLYESVRLAMDVRLKDIIAKKGLQRSQIEILDALLKLRQVCNHPQLLAMQSAKKIKQSAKLEFLMDTVPELISEGRKILIFSQFTSMLALIEAELDKENIAFVKLTGASRNRQQLVEQFQTGDIPVFLISLRAGGVGLNLTAADTVIHFDPWWNPAVENQATDRAHRIGQDKPVFVYKLIIENSIEEKIQQIQQTKAELANSLLSEEVSEGKLTLTNDVLEALMAPLS